MYKLAAAALSLLVLVAAGPVEPDRVERRTVRLTQTVTLHDVPDGARQVRLWVPIPSDAQWQRVLDRQVIAAPGRWRLEQQELGRGDFIYAEVDRTAAGTLSVQVA